MDVEYFIGITPPKEYAEKIELFQSKWMKLLTVEPHITLKAQGGLTPDKSWLENVQKVCNSFEPFIIVLEKPAFLGETILYLSVNSNQLYKLHQEIVQEISPSEDQIKKYFELELFVPHLTLGKEYSGDISTQLSKNDLIVMEKMAIEELTPYPEFEVNFVRIYELNREKGRYEKYLDIPLNISQVK